MKEQLLQYWDKLQSREKKLLIGAGVFIILMLLYLMVQSSYQRTSTVELNLKKEQQLLAWMPPVVDQILLSRSQEQGELITSANLLAQVERSMADAGLSELLATLNLVADNDVQLAFNDVVYESLVAWLFALSKQGVIVKEFVATKAEAIGEVNANISLSAVS